jgi:hypothetical protein
MIRHSPASIPSFFSSNVCTLSWSWSFNFCLWPWALGPLSFHLSSLVFVLWALGVGLWSFFLYLGFCGWRNMSCTCFIACEAWLGLVSPEGYLVISNIYQQWKKIKHQDAKPVVLGSNQHPQQETDNGPRITRAMMSPEGQEVPGVCPGPFPLAFKPFFFYLRPSGVQRTGFPYLLELGWKPK